MGKQSAAAPAAGPSALLCDLDGVCRAALANGTFSHTAHELTRSGRSADDGRTFVDSLVTSTLDSLTGRPGVARQLAHRLRSLLAGDMAVAWTRYR